MFFVSFKGLSGTLEGFLCVFFISFKGLSGSPTGLLSV